MVTALLSALPLVSILAAFIYAAVTGASLYRSSGFVSVLGVAVTLAGLTLGRLLDRFVSLPRGLDDWVNYRDAADSQAITRSDRFLAVFSVEVALLFVFAAIISFVAVALINRDAGGRTRSLPRSRQFAPLGALFVVAVGLTARGKLALCAAYLLARAHLL
jgi:hypothetical protein